MSLVDKAALRESALARREDIPAEMARRFADRLARLGPELARAHGASSVSAFSSIGAEIDTKPLIAALHAAGFVVGLPVTGRRGSPLLFRQWTPETEMRPGKMDIPEPPPSAASVEPDLLFVPLAAFDRRGHRIGYGAGFYDLTLAALRARKRITAVGLAYAEQEVLFIPDEEHDQPLDVVLTERDLIVCTADA